MSYSIGTTYEGKDFEYLRRILPFVGHIEVSPDSIARRSNGRTDINPESLAHLQWMQRNAKTDLLLHGVGLSIGSYDGYSKEYIRLLDQLFTSLDITWHSEHLAYTMVNGENLGTMLTLPHTDEVIDLVCRRIDAIQNKYKVPFLIENVITMLPLPDAPYTEAAFLNRITSLTGCGLILDIYNIECDQHNFGLDPIAFFDELNMESVYEMHLAGGLVDEDHQFRMDIHTGTVAQSTRDLALSVLDRQPPNLKAITFEILEEFIPYTGTENIIREINQLNQIFNRHGSSIITDKSLQPDQIEAGSRTAAG